MLVDLVQGSTSVVAVLEYGSGTAFLIRDQSGDAELVRVVTPLSFRPKVAHLGSRLRVAGLCDAGPDCMTGSPQTNPVLEFATLPDGGPW